MGEAWAELPKTTRGRQPAATEPAKGRRGGTEPRIAEGLAASTAHVGAARRTEGLAVMKWRIDSRILGAGKVGK